MLRMIDRRTCRWRENFFDGRSVLEVLCRTWKQASDQSREFDAGQPIIPDSFEEALIGVIFLCLGLQHLEFTDQSKILFELALSRHDFALRNQRLAVNSNDLAHHANAFSYGIDRAYRRDLDLGKAGASNPKTRF